MLCNKKQSKEQWFKLTCCVEGRWNLAEIPSFFIKNMAAWGSLIKKRKVVSKLIDTQKYQKFETSI